MSSPRVLLERRTPSWEASFMLRVFTFLLWTAEGDVSLFRITAFTYKYEIDEVFHKTNCPVTRGLENAFILQEVGWKLLWNMLFGLGHGWNIQIFTLGGQVAILDWRHNKCFLRNNFSKSNLKNTKLQYFCTDTFFGSYCGGSMKSFHRNHEIPSFIVFYYCFWLIIT